MKQHIAGDVVRRCGSLFLLGMLTLPIGCGTTLSRKATEQLLASDAVDRSVSRIDFRDLAGKKVYFDTKYINAVKGVGFVNSDYIISSLRQQMVAAELLLQDKPEDAEYIIEGRVGALGTNGHEVTYGMPQSSSLSNVINTASSMVPTMPALPTLPEISVAKKNAELAAAKLSLFAYHKETRRPVWQSGTSQATSTAKDTWVFGAGPFQSGTIYEGPQFAGNKIGLPFFRRGNDERNGPPVHFDEEYHFKEQAQVALHPGFAALKSQPEVQSEPKTEAAEPEPEVTARKATSPADNLKLLSNEIEELQKAQSQLPPVQPEPESPQGWWKPK